MVKKPVCITKRKDELINPAAYDQDERKVQNLHEK